MFIIYCVFFPRPLKSLPTPPRQHSAPFGCTINDQPIGITVHSHCVECFEGLLQRWRLAVNCEKHNFLMNTLHQRTAGGSNLRTDGKSHLWRSLRTEIRLTQTRFSNLWQPAYVRCCYHWWKSNFPMTLCPFVGLLDGRLVCQSNFFKEGTLPCSYRSTCLRVGKEFTMLIEVDEEGRWITNTT